MIVISGTFTIDPADRDAFLEAAKPAMAGTLQEDGCHAYVMTADIVDPAVVHIFEKWEGEDKLGPHMKSDHMRTFGRALKELKVSGRNLTVYEVASEKAL